MSEKKVLFKNTADQLGRNWIITPANSELEGLGYARIILNDEEPEVEYSNPDFESALICLGGEGEVTLNGDSYSLGPVYNNDAVVIKKGYHPNVAIPGHSINFVWIMATLDPSMERSWSDVNTQPEFAGE